MVPPRAGCGADGLTREQFLFGLHPSRLPLLLLRAANAAESSGLDCGLTELAELAGSEWRVGLRVRLLVL